MDKKQYIPPEETFAFHGHRCPFMPIGYRMGLLALERMGIEREKDSNLFVFTELGEAHPQTCMIDGMQSSTGATYGKTLITRTYYGKLAATFYHPGKNAVRFSLNSDFVDEMMKFKFFDYRKQGMEASQVPPEAAKEVIEWIYDQSNETMFTIKDLPDFSYVPPKNSFAKAKCSVCGEYVFERYLRTKDGKPICIPCSGYEKK